MHFVDLIYIIFLNEIKIFLYLSFQNKNFIKTLLNSLEMKFKFLYKDLLQQIIFSFLSLYKDDHEVLLRS